MPSLIRRHLMVSGLLMPVLGVSAQESSRRDGNWWRSQPRTSQIDYLTGFFDGMDLGNSFSYWGLPRDKTYNEAVASVIKSYNDYTAKYFKNVTNFQLADGLDVFYADFRNRTILVSHAVWLVVNQISGKPKEEMEMMIESWRRNATR